LGQTLAILLLGAALATRLHGQVAVEGPIRLSRVQGYVVDSNGKPAPNLEATLSRDETVVYRTHTGPSGAFRFDHASGRLWFRVARSKDAPAAREIVVQPEIATLLARRKLYVVLGPGACADECSSVYTSRESFDRAIRRLTGHNY